MCFSKCVQFASGAYTEGMSEHSPQLRSSLDFDRSTVKHALQNTQNDCHQCLSDSSRVHKICFRLELHLVPSLGGVLCYAGLSGPKGRGREVKG